MNPEREIVVLTLSRSGHHAIVNWIAKQHDGPITHQNNCVYGWENGQLLPFNTNTTRIYDQRGPHCAALYSLETFDLDDFYRYSLWVSETPREFYLVLRDPFNWIASCWIGGGEGRAQLSTPFRNERGEEKESTINLWKKQARYCIKHRLDSGPHIGFISYNEWFSNRNYRRSLAGKLEIPFTDAGLEEVPTFGGGSSAHGLMYNNVAQKLDVLDRWRMVAEVSEYLDLIMDDELDELSQQLFSLRNPLA